ncbi:hypothetical protein SPRG_00828 [Saprolegnia parasitica CBS 223.65]|uniref:Uncharacterized protein n=1 Tax=Saprolegnia parasitica (strain CBS 223.65) TaxID=695850 RepID=A0A067D6Z4_SAPPC|nr:hypothetical protein SPRG_00828 [Saprolegnia parasitica CBS 223.65]KDO34767.1 hypothetical protein SPRG_00828 [Saprolegnia parasitica CBS 223.65]|eukprot:XP_012194434.1 hypothetical protein SPRG_00828 [Saprolegnia parasitica CBS 223.65]
MSDAEVLMASVFPHLFMLDKGTTEIVVVSYSSARATNKAHDMQRQGKTPARKAIDTKENAITGKKPRIDASSINILPAKRRTKGLMLQLSNIYTITNALVCNHDDFGRIFDPHLHFAIRFYNATIVRSVDDDSTIPEIDVSATIATLPTIPAFEVIEIVGIVAMVTEIPAFEVIEIVAMVTKTSISGMVESSSTERTMVSFMNKCGNTEAMSTSFRSNSQIGSSSLVTTATNGSLAPGHLRSYHQFAATG